MRVDIKEVEAIRDDSFGTFHMKRRNYAVIKISRKLNDTVAEYAATTLHELLHLWIAILRLQDFRVADRTEHRFINDAEKTIIKSAKRYLRRKKHGKRSR